MRFTFFARLSLALALTLAPSTAGTAAGGAAEQSRSIRAALKSDGRRHTAVTSDVLVYGANSAGVISAIAAAKEGATVSLLCNSWPDCWPPNERVGGLTTGGLGMTDSCHQSDGEQIDTCQLSITGALTREFYNRSASRYFPPNGWLPAQARCKYVRQNNTRHAVCPGSAVTNPNMPYNLEPSVALSVYHQMMDEVKERLTVFYSAQVLPDGVAKSGSVINSLTLDDGRQFVAKSFVDASYEGDLLRFAGVNYTVGRESRAQYNESWAGRRHGSDGSENEWQVGVSPFDEQGKLLPGLLSEQDAAEIVAPFEADGTVMAYNFRLCVTQNVSNMVPFEKPAEYHPEDWELLRRYLNKTSSATMPSCNCAEVPNSKWDMNNCGPVASDLQTADYTNKTWRHLTSWAWPEANYEMRREIWRVHKTYLQGLLWTLSHDPSVDAKFRAATSSFGLCKDEFVENGHWPTALYQREVRRMVGDRVFTQRDVDDGVKKGTDIGLLSLGISAHAEDSHNMQRFACKDKNTPPCYGDGPRDATGPYAWDEGDYHGKKQGTGIYQLPKYMCLPVEEQASNLLVVAAPSASHVAFSTFRMEPAFMVLGNSVGIWAALAAKQPGGAARAVSDSALNAALESAGQVLRMPGLQPGAGAGFSCTPFATCVKLASCTKHPGCSTSGSCSGACAAIGAEQWLASQGSDGGFALDETAGTLKALSAKSYLKKAETHSSELPAEEKRLVPQGTVLSVAKGKAPSADGYWLVTLATATSWQ